MLHFDMLMQETWLYHLIVASAGGRGTADTGSRAVSDYEQLVLNLMFVDGDSSSPHWNDVALLHTKEPTLSHPLTTLHSDELQKKALDMYKAHIFVFIFAEDLFFDLWWWWCSFRCGWWYQAGNLFRSTAAVLLDAFIMCRGKIFWF